MYRARRNPRGQETPNRIGWYGLGGPEAKADWSEMKAWAEANCGERAFIWNLDVDGRPIRAGHIGVPTTESALQEALVRWDSFYGLHIQRAQTVVYVTGVLGVTDLNPRTRTL